jgi:hypothetical protein
MTERIQFGLVDNALDFVLSAAEHAKEDAPREWKYALLHLKVDSADRNALRTGDFTSVGFETACKRLASIAGVEISASSMTHLDDLRKLRNQIQHFGIDADLEQVRSLMAKGTNIFVDQVSLLLGDQLSPAQQASLEEIHAHLTDFDEYVTERRSTIEEDLAGHSLGRCPACWEWAIPLGAQDLRCRFCNKRTNPREVADAMTEGPVNKECLTCGEITLAFVVYNNDDGGFHCTSCGSVQRCCLPAAAASKDGAWAATGTF